MFSYIASSLLAVSVLSGAADYTNNGSDWPDLCQTGMEQSPIDLTSDTDTSDKMEIIGYNYYDFVKTGHSDSDFSRKIDFNDDALRANAELQLTFADESQSYFTPKQFHFHAPSEHTVDGYLYDAEVHLVHVYKGSGTDSAGDDLGASAELYGAVIGIFFDMVEGGSTANPFLESVFAAIDDPTSKVEMRQFLSTIDMGDYFSYDGSFTTPPCTEGIKWSVIKQVQPISQAQLDKFKSKMTSNAQTPNGNNRVIMPLNDRTLFYSGATQLIAGAAAALTALAVLTF